MKAALVSDSGVRIGDVPKPRPAANQVLVRVRASSLNRADLLVAGGHMHGAIGGPGTVLGLEFAGEVEAIGSDVRDVREGDRVMCSGSGGHAEYAVADWGRVAPKPTHAMSFEQAATLPVALQTMHDAVVSNGRLKAGEAVLIQGASSGSA
jgi:NADPH:quinone reductase